MSNQHRSMNLPRSWSISAGCGLRPLRINLLEYKFMGAERGIFPLMRHLPDRGIRDPSADRSRRRNSTQRKMQTVSDHLYIGHFVKGSCAGTTPPAGGAVPYRQVGLQRRRDTIVVDGLQFGSCQQRLQRGPIPFLFSLSRRGRLRCFSGRGHLPGPASSSRASNAAR